VLHGLVEEKFEVALAIAQRPGFVKLLPPCYKPPAMQYKLSSIFSTLNRSMDAFCASFRESLT
jgi:hypothetical protein